MGSSALDEESRCASHSSRHRGRGAFLNSGVKSSRSLGVFVHIVQCLRCNIAFLSHTRQPWGHQKGNRASATSGESQHAVRQGSRVAQRDVSDLADKVPCLVRRRRLGLTNPLSRNREAEVRQVTTQPREPIPWRPVYTVSF